MDSQDEIIDENGGLFCTFCNKKQESYLSNCPCTSKMSIEEYTELFNKRFPKEVK